MSHVIGEIRFKDGTIRYAEYNGTSDIMNSLSYNTIKDVNDNWRKPYKEPNCNHEHIEDVELYGNGITWNGECCKDCGWIINGENPYEDELREEYLIWRGLK